MDKTKRCPLCGEIILAEATRCRYCHVELSPESGRSVAPEGRVVPLTPSVSAEPAQEPPREPGPMSAQEFERRLWELTFTTDYLLTGPTVAFALKIPIDEALEHLEDLAARDHLIRQVDAYGSLVFHVPNRQHGRHATTAKQQLVGVAQPGGVNYQQPPVGLVPLGTTNLTQIGPESHELLTAPSEGTALAALLVNTLCLPGLGSIIGGRSSAGIGQLLLFLIGTPLIFLVVGAPMMLSAWIWALITGIDIMNQAKQAQTQRRLSSG